MTTADLNLRDYQQNGRTLVHSRMREGSRRVILAMPTGSGKRRVMIAEALKGAEQEREVLIVTDRRQLVIHAIEDLHDFGIGYGVIMEGFEPDRIPRIQVGTIQSFAARFFHCLPEERPRVDLILIDEGHKAIEQYAALMELYPNALVVMFTATPVGPAGRTLVQPGYADCYVEPITNSQLIRRGYLLPTLVIAPSEPDIQGVRILRKEEFAEGQLSRRVEQVTCFGDVFNEWAPFADRKTIVFGPGIDFLHGLCGSEGRHGDSFYARGIRAEIISSKVKSKDRERILRDFIDGELKVLLSVDILKEGVDIPAASCAIDLQPNAQFRGYWQKVGRIKRPFPGQEQAVYIDMAGNYWRFPHPDDDPDWSEITGDTTTQDAIQAARNERNMPPSIRCPKCAEVRKSGPRCPSCGHEAQPQEIVRRIRMGNGKLREIPAEEKRKHEKTDMERRRDKWKSTLFIGMKSGKTMKQCIGIHKGKFGDWPGRDLPCMPPEGSAQWALKVNQLYDARGLMREFGKQ